MPSVQEILRAAGLEDTEENRGLLLKIAPEYDLKLRDEAVFRGADWQTKILPSTKPPVQVPRSLERAFGKVKRGDLVPGGQLPKYSLGQRTILPPPETREARRGVMRRIPTLPGQLGVEQGMRIGARAIEGISKPILQILGEASETFRTHYPGGAFNLEGALEAQGYLGQAGFADRILGGTAETAAFFAPITAAQKAIAAASRVPWLIKTIAQPAILGVSSVLETRSQQKQLGIEPTVGGDWSTFWHSMMMVGAGAAFGKYTIKGIDKLRKTPLGDEMRNIISQPAVGAAFGYYSGHKGKLSRDETLEEMLTSALGFLTGSYMGAMFKGEARPRSGAQAERTMDAAVAALSEEANRPYQKFEEMAATNPEAAAELRPITTRERATYKTKLASAWNLWTNSQVPLEKTVKTKLPVEPSTGEKVAAPPTKTLRVTAKPTVEQLVDAFQITKQDAERIVQTRPTEAEAAEIRQNRIVDAVVQEAKRRGNKVLSETMYRMGVMPEPERQVYEARRARFTPEETDALSQQIPTVKEAIKAAEIPQDRALVPVRDFPPGTEPWSPPVPGPPSEYPLATVPGEWAKSRGEPIVPPLRPTPAGEMEGYETPGPTISLFRKDLEKKQARIAAKAKAQKDRALVPVRKFPPGTEPWSFLVPGPPSEYPLATVPGEWAKSRGEPIVPPLRPTPAGEMEGYETPGPTISLFRKDLEKKQARIAAKTKAQKETEARKAAGWTPLQRLGLESLVPPKNTKRNKVGPPVPGTKKAPPAAALAPPATKTTPVVSPAIPEAFRPATGKSEAKAAAGGVGLGRGRQAQGQKARAPEVAPAPAPTTTELEQGRRQEQAGTSPPPGQAVAAPLPVQTPEQMSLRLDEIKADLGKKGLAPPERTKLQQERTALTGTTFPPETISERKISEVMKARPKKPRSPTGEREIKRYYPSDKPPPRKVVEAVESGERKAEEAEKILGEAKPDLPPPIASATYTSNPDAYMKAVGWWVGKAAERLPAPEKPVYDPVNSKTPGPRAAERLSAEINRIYFSSKGTPKETRAALEAAMDRFLPEFKAEGKGDPNAPGRQPVGDFVGKLILATGDAMRKWGPAGVALSDAGFRVWRSSLQRLAMAKLEVDKLDRGGTNHAWDKELNDTEREHLHDFFDAYGAGKRGDALPSLANINEQMAAAASMWAKYRRADVAGLTLEQQKAAESMGDWLRAYFGTHAEDAIAANMPFKAWTKSPYMPVFLRSDVWAPVIIEKLGPFDVIGPKVRTDRGWMSKAEYEKAVAKSRSLQDEIVRQMVQKGGYAEGDVTAALNRYRDTYTDPYSKSMNELLKEGVDHAPSNIELHRMFDVDSGQEMDPAVIWKRYGRQNGLAIEMAREFGPNRERAEALIHAAKVDGYQVSMLAKLFDVAMLQDPMTRQKAPRMMKELRGSLFFSKLGQAPLWQIPQHLTISAHIGFEDYFKAIPLAIQKEAGDARWLPEWFKKDIRSDTVKRWMAESGFLVENEIETALANTKGVMPKAATFMIEASGLKFGDRFARETAVIGGHLYAERYLRIYEKIPGQARTDAAKRLTELYTDPQMRELALKGKWTPDEYNLLLNMAGEGIGYRTQFRTLAIDMPMMFSHPIYRAIYDLNGFAWQATRENFRNFNPNNPTSVLRNPARMAEFLAGMTAAGFASWYVQRFKDLSSGKNIEDKSELESMVDTLTGLGIMPALVNGWYVAAGTYGDPAARFAGAQGAFAGEIIKTGTQVVSGGLTGGPKEALRPIGRFAIRTVPFLPAEWVRSTEWGQENIPTRKEIANKYFPAPPKPTVRGGGVRTTRPRGQR